MSTFLLITAGVLFIVTFGIHCFIVKANKFDEPLYARKPIMAVLPWICGFVLPVICWTLLLDLHWIALFFINFVAVYLLGPVLTKGLLERFASGKGLGYDMLYSLAGGLIAFVIGIAINGNSSNGTISKSSYHTDSDYKYEHRTGSKGNYTYNYDVTGTDNDGNSVDGNIDMSGKYGRGTITDDDGNEKEVDLEWTGAGQLEATDEEGNTYNLEVE